MDNFLEILVPLIFAAIYFFGNMFSGKKEEDEDVGRSRPSRPAQTTPEQDAERRRQIQEDIRRKILERRRAAGGQPAPASPSVETAAEPQRHAAERTREVHERVKEAAGSRSEPEPQPVAPAQSAGFDWDTSDNVYDNVMEARLKRIEETKRQAEALRRKADAARKGAGQASGREARSGSAIFAGPVRDSLNSPSAARVAFVYGEVLGRPLSMRQSSDLPGLSR